MGGACHSHSTGASCRATIAYNRLTQMPKEELADFKNWTSSVIYTHGSA
ncbi:hypothetical protein Q7O56_23500 [Pseudomonas protegens]|nr:hypothetical protein [Pseudomonas protegens]MDP9512002.1 hypothetical protein [Pseudomonas protegens]